MRQAMDRVELPGRGLAGLAGLGWTGLGPPPPLKTEGLAWARAEGLAEAGSRVPEKPTGGQTWLAPGSRLQPTYTNLQGGQMVPGVSCRSSKGRERKGEPDAVGKTADGSTTPPCAPPTHQHQQENPA